MCSPKSLHGVNYAAPRSFGTILKANLKETLFPDDPFHEFKNEKLSTKILKGIQYFIPICQWMPKYSLGLFKYDLLSGITIASLAIPQGISYAKLAELPPIIGLCKLYTLTIHTCCSFITTPSILEKNCLSYYLNSQKHNFFFRDFVNILNC